MEGTKVIGWAARDSSGHFSRYSFTLRKTGAEDVLFKVLYCGVDHTDLHQVRGEIAPTSYPLIPGHEVVGEVVEVGSEVRKFKVGDIIGVGCIIWSCGECSSCKSKMEQYCNERIFAYNALDKDGRTTRGGYSSAMLVNQRFVVQIPDKLAPEQAAPLLCAGVTAYSPLKQFNQSDEVLKAGIIGLGGVGHLGVLIAKDMGHHVTVISSYGKKRYEALEHLGADAFLVSSNADEMEKVDGKIVIVGAAPKPLQFTANGLITEKKNISGSFVGSIEDLQELLEFRTEKGLTSMIELVKIDYVNQAFERMERNDVKYKFVLDVAGSNLE